MVWIAVALCDIGVCCIGGIHLVVWVCVCVCVWWPLPLHYIQLIYSSTCILSSSSGCHSLAMHIYLSLITPTCMHPSLCWYTIDPQCDRTSHMCVVACVDISIPTSTPLPYVPICSIPLRVRLAIRPIRVLLMVFPLPHYHTYTRFGIENVFI